MSALERPYTELSTQNCHTLPHSCICWRRQKQ